MGQPFERPGTWYSLIRASLVEEAAGSGLTPHQVQALMARLRAGHVFSTPTPDYLNPADSPRSYGLSGLEPDRDKKQPPRRSRRAEKWGVVEDHR